MSSPTISVTASARQEEVPDWATVDAVAIGTGESAAAALASARDRVDTMQASLRTEAVDTVRTVELQVEDTDEMWDPVTDAPFEATAYLEVRCTPENAEKAVIMIADGGGNVREVRFRLDKDRSKAVKDAALNAATERARAKAERIAAAEGLEITGVQKISTAETPRENNTIVDDALSDFPDKNLQPSSIEIVETVEAIYEVAVTSK